MRPSTEKSEIFSERLISLRNALQCSQKELGKRLGFSKNYVYMLEKGRRPGRKAVEQVRRLESALSEQSETGFRYADAPPSIPLMLREQNASGPATHENIARLTTPTHADIQEIAKSLNELKERMSTVEQNLLKLLAKQDKVYST